MGKEKGEKGKEKMDKKEGRRTRNDVCAKKAGRDRRDEETGEGRDRGGSNLIGYGNEKNEPSHISLLVFAYNQASFPTPFVSTASVRKTTTGQNVCQAGLHRAKLSCLEYVTLIMGKTHLERMEDLWNNASFPLLAKYTV